MNADLLVRRIAIVSGVLVILILILSTIYTTTTRVGKIAVQIRSFPQDATITIDDKVIKPGVVYLRSGVYEIQAEKAGFKSHNEELVLKDTERTVGIILTPTSREAIEWSKQHETEYLKAQSAGERAAYEIGKSFNEQNPIAKHLPYRTFFYTIGYRADKSDPTGSSIVIEIDAPEGYRQGALNRIRRLGYDPTDFTINFRNYENPFPL